MRTLLILSTFLLASGTSTWGAASPQPAEQQQEPTQGASPPGAQTESAVPAPAPAERRAFTGTLPSHVVDGSTGTRFDGRMQVEGVSYRCLGAGVRKVLFFKAYAVTFCLDERRMDQVVGGYLDKSHPGLEGRALEDALRKDQAFFDHLANVSADKLVVMQLVRDISKDRIASAFRDSLGEVLPQDRVEKLIATIPGDGKDGQKILLHSHGTQLVIDIAGDAKRLDDQMITKNLWRVWLGSDPVAPSLKDSISSTVTQAR